MLLKLWNQQFSFYGFVIGISHIMVFTSGINETWLSHQIFHQYVHLMVNCRFLTVKGDGMELSPYTINRSEAGL